MVPNILSFYCCEKCGEIWESVWTCACDDECAVCGTTMTPYYSDEEAKVDITKADAALQALQADRAMDAPGAIQVEQGGFWRYVSGIIRDAKTGLIVDTGSSPVPPRVRVSATLSELKASIPNRAFRIAP